MFHRKSTYNPNVHHRRSIRLKAYDYAQAGAYCVTVVVGGREYLLGEIVESAMRLSGCGQIVEECWNGLPEHFSNVELDEWVVMPNHVHGIVVLSENAGRLGSGDGSNREIGLDG